MPRNQLTIEMQVKSLVFPGFLKVRFALAGSRTVMPVHRNQNKNSLGHSLLELSTDIALNKNL